MNIKLLTEELTAIRPCKDNHYPMGVLRRLDRDVVLLQPDVVIIAIGTNDIFAKLGAFYSSMVYILCSTPNSYQAVMIVF